MFMLKSIFGKWKQPIAYSFCEGTTKTPVLIRTIKEIVRAVHQTGLQIVAVVCDQAATNVAAINSLVNDTKADYLRKGSELRDRIIEVDGHQIIPIYDPPHLLKGISNNFLTKNILYKNKKEKTCVAKWQHIINAYIIDNPCGRLRLMKNLTDQHVYPAKIKKMKV